MRTKAINRAIAYIMNAMKRAEEERKATMRFALQRLRKAKEYDRGNMFTSADQCLIDAFELLRSVS